LALLVLPLALGWLTSGCASMQTPEVHAWRDPQYNPTPANKFALTERPNASPVDAQLGNLVVAELQAEGFQLVPYDQADYLLTYVFENTVEEDGYHPVFSAQPMMAPPQTTDQIGNPSLQSGMVQTVVVTPNLYPVKDIRFYLYTNPKTNGGRFQLAWQGSISQGKSVPAKNEPALIKTLLGCLGKEQDGPVKLSP
jgi:hypothetical protein